MDCPDWPTRSTETIEIFAKVEDHDDRSPEAKKPTGSMTKSDHIIVHRAFLESSSKFFQNALSDASWKEGSEKRMELIASPAVLEGFGNWLYRRAPNPFATWQFWIDLYIFSCEYLITELTMDVLDEMLSHLGGACWIPSLEQIDDVYERTSEDSHLRSMAVSCFSSNVKIGKASILRAANEAFVRDYAVNAAAGSVDPLKDTMKHCGHPRPKRYHGASMGLTGFMSFTVKDRDEAGIIHCGLFNSSLAFEGKPYSVTYPAVHRWKPTEATFRTFTSWIYFNNDLCSEKHECQISPNLINLLDCYEMSLALGSCKVKPAGGEEEKSLCYKIALEGLHTQAHEYKLCLIKAIRTYCERKDDAPSGAEIIMIYTITRTGDPLRSLVVDLFISRNKSRVGGTVHSEFQRELNARLAEQLNELRDYVDKERSMRNDIQKMKGYSLGMLASPTDRTEIEKRMRKLVEFEAPQPKAAECSMAKQLSLLKV